MRIADVAIEYTGTPFDSLSYLATDLAVVRGCRVQVRVQGRLVVGLVEGIRDVDPQTLSYTLQPIEQLIDPQPVLDERQFALADFLAKTNGVSRMAAYQTILPGKLRPRSSATKSRKVRMVHLANKEIQVRGKTQQILLAALQQQDLTYQEARRYCGSLSVLIKAGVIECYEVEQTHREQPVAQQLPDYPLTNDQQQVLDTLDISCEGTWLLYGPTGSGKTEVYLRVAANVLSQGKQVLLMVPEIALTPQMIQQTALRFGMDVGVYHSGLNEQQRYEQYMRVKEQQVQLVVGTRSAVFLPFTELGLIVMDEEHDLSYKSQMSPFYHARDIARYRAHEDDCPLLLGSASPSFESYAQAKRGQYHFLRLHQRIHQHLPQVQIVDTQQWLRSGHADPLTPPLQKAIQTTIEKGEQVLLLLNRRGYMTYLKQDDGTVLQCPDCDVALNYHRDDWQLHCHQCGYRMPLPRQGRFVGGGIGTQRLEVLLQEHFPQAKVMRLDADSARYQGATGKILADFAAHKADILVGTQMIAKGLDLPLVTLVGILNADQALNRLDYRSSELAFDLMLQAAGRSGRKDRPGQVIIQSFQPDHYALKLAAQHDYPTFFATEMRYRKLAQYPPYTHLISLVVSDPRQAQTEKAIEYLRELIGEPDQIKVLGPIPLLRLARRYRARVMLKGKDIASLRELAFGAAAQLKQKYPGIRMLINVHPLVIES